MMDLKKFDCFNVYQTVGFVRFQGPVLFIRFLRISIRCLDTIDSETNNQSRRTCDPDFRKGQVAYES